MVSVETLIDRSIRNMGAVHPLVKDKIIEVIREAYSEGIRVQISSGYRSFQEQAWLYAKGRRLPGDIVTNAEPGESVHNYGLAVDYFLVSRDGTDSIWVVNDDWIRVAELAKAKGFDWGGDWTSFKDYPHLQLIEGHTWRDLYNGWRPSFWGDYEIGEMTTDYDPIVKGVEIELLLSNGDQGPEVRDLQEDLKGLGYYDGKIDGIYGPNTTDAVKAFQADHGLTVDGIAGPRTLGKLKAILQANDLHDWGKEAWAWATENGITDGTRPQDYITREEAVVMLYRQEVK